MAETQTSETTAGHRYATLADISRQVWAEFGAVTEQAIERWWSLVEMAGREDEARAFAATMNIEAERRKDNAPHFSRVRALTDRLSVEHVASSVQDRVSSLESVMVSEDSGRGYAGRRPVSALRAFLSVTCRVNGHVWKVSNMRREELSKAIEQWQRQARGCWEHAEMARDMLREMHGTERAIDAVRRLEQE